MSKCGYLQPFLLGKSVGLLQEINIDWLIDTPSTIYFWTSFNRLWLEYYCCWTVVHFTFPCLYTLFLQIQFPFHSRGWNFPYHPSFMFGTYNTHLLDFLQHLIIIHTFINILRLVIPSTPCNTHLQHIFFGLVAPSILYNTLHTKTFSHLQHPVIHTFNDLFWTFKLPLGRQFAKFYFHFPLESVIHHISA